MFKTNFLELLYNNTGKIIVLLFLFNFVIQFLMEKWSMESDKLLEYYLYFFFGILIFFFFFHIHYCGESCIKKKKYNLMIRKENERKRAIKLEKKYQECIKNGGESCSYCGEPIDCKLENNINYYYCSHECNSEANYDPSDVYYRK